MKPLYLAGEDMFVVVTYDVNQKRCQKVMKYLRQWLEHRQRSVFSGFLTHKQVELMKHGLFKIIKPGYDSVIIFQSNKADQITEWTTQRAEEVRMTSNMVETGEERRDREARASLEKQRDEIDKGKMRFRFKS